MRACMQTYLAHEARHQVPRLRVIRLARVVVERMRVMRNRLYLATPAESEGLESSALLVGEAGDVFLEHDGNLHRGARLLKKIRDCIPMVNQTVRKNGCFPGS